MNTPDAIAHPDRVQDGSAGPSADDTGEDGVDAIEVRLGGMGDEVLAPSGIGTGERHPDGARFVPNRIDLVADREPGPAPAVAPRIPVLHDEVRHHPMPAGAVKIVAVVEGEEGPGRGRGPPRPQADIARAAGRVPQRTPACSPPAPAPPAA